VQTSNQTAGAGPAVIPPGAKRVRFEVCISGVVFTLRRQSAVYLTFSRRERFRLGFWYSLAALCLGPWAVPWGLIWTPRAVWVNLTGGIDADGDRPGSSAAGGQPGSQPRGGAAQDG
jgi:hypothetical protein